MQRRGRSCWSTSSDNSSSPGETVGAGCRLTAHAVGGPGEAPASMWPAPSVDAAKVGRALGSAGASACRQAAVLLCDHGVGHDRL